MSPAFGFSVEARGTSRKLFNQVHGNQIWEVKDASHAETLRAAPPEGDGAFTRARGLELSVFSADCIPVLLYTPRAVGAVHSGWRGTMRRVLPALRGAMGPDETDLWAVIGPCIRGCCFEVRADFVAAFREAGHPIDRYLETRAGSLYCHLPELLLETQLGDLPKSQIDTTQLRCTVCSEPKLPSFRRNRSTDPHIRAWIKA